MKHLRKFETLNDYYSAQIYRPSISLIEETNGLMHDGREIRITTGWDSRINNRKAVIVDGDITLGPETYDCYSIQFTNNGHLTINEGARLRIWRGGIINDDCNTVNYFTLKQNNVEKTYSEFLIHPEVTINNHPKATVSIILNSYTVSSSNYRHDAISIPTINVIDDVTVTKNNENIQSFFRYYKTNGWYNIGYLNVSGQSFRKDSMNQPFMHYTVQANTPEVGSVLTLTGNLYGNLDKTLQTTDVTVERAPFDNSFSAKFATTKLFDILDEPKQLEYGWLPSIMVDESNLSYYPSITPFSCPFYIKTSNTIKSWTINYRTWVWDYSFEDLSQQAISNTSRRLLTTTNDTIINQEMLESAF